MNWDALGAIGEVISAVAVVITLLYLAIQMRQNSRQTAENTKAVRLSARGTTQEFFSRFRHLVASSSEVAQLYLKGCADYRALSDAERVQFGNLLQELLLAWDLRHMHIREGLQESVSWERQKPFLLAALRQPGVQYYWSRNRAIFSPDFVAAVDSSLTSAFRDESVAAQQGAAAAEPQRIPIDPL